MPRLVDLLPPSSDTPGIYWHKASKRFLCQVGYHNVTVTDEDGLLTPRLSLLDL